MTKRQFNIVPHECAVLAEMLGNLRQTGAVIPPTPKTVDALLELVAQVVGNDALWAALPAYIDCESKHSLRNSMRGYVTQAQG